MVKNRNSFPKYYLKPMSGQKSLEGDSLFSQVYTYIMHIEVLHGFLQDGIPPESSTCLIDRLCENDDAVAAMDIGDISDDLHHLFVAEKAQDMISSSKNEGAGTWCVVKFHTGSCCDAFAKLYMYYVQADNRIFTRGLKLHVKPVMHLVLSYLYTGS